MKLQLYNEILELCLSTMQTACGSQGSIFKDGSVSEFDTQVTKWITKVILPAIVEKSHKDKEEGRISDINITIKYLNGYVYIGTPTEKRPFCIILDSNDISEKGLSTTNLDEVMNRIVSVFSELQSDGNKITGKIVTNYSWEFSCPVN